MVTAANEFLLEDQFLEEVRIFVLESGKFNVAEVQQKFRVGYRRAIFLRNALVEEAILDPVETDGQNWLSGNVVLVNQEDELEEALEKIVKIVGPAGSRDFERLVKVMAVDRASGMRMVIIAGVQSLLGVLGGR